MKKTCLIALLTALSGTRGYAQASHEPHGLLRRLDSLLVASNKQDIDTSFVIRPEARWTIRGRLNVSGAEIEMLGVRQGKAFSSKMEAQYKTTLSLGVSYRGLSLSLSLNPAKLMGKYGDFEFNFNSYGKRFGFDVAYHDASNFSGWYEQQGEQRIELPSDILALKTLNVNAYYVFNHRRFSYPAAFTQSYIQRHSAGSVLLAFSGQTQRGELRSTENFSYSMLNLGLGAGYGYNYVPVRNWLLHLSAMTAFILYSNTSTTFGDSHVPLHYQFPETIITGRGAIVRQFAGSFCGISMVYNFTHIGQETSLSVHNTKWLLRVFYGIRI